jgi:hypothetical protein
MLRNRCAPPLKVATRHPMMRPAMPGPALQELAPDLWIASRRLPMWIGEIGCRMTVVRLGSELILHSPVPLDAATRAALDRLGRVRWIVGPSKVHHFSLGDYVAAYPDAMLCGAPGLPEKRPDLRFQCVLDDAVAPPWGAGLPMRQLRGAPMMNEVVLFHPPSRTLVLTDLAFNVPADGGGARVFHWLVGATGRFGPHRIVRLGIRDRAAAGASLEAMRAWDFDRVIVSHGDVLERGGKAAFERAFARWLC